MLLSVDQTAERDELVEQEGPDPDGFATVHYKLPGVIEWSRPETSEATIRCGDFTFLVRLSDLDRVCAACALAVILEYEWLAFGLPNVRRDWRVNAVKIEHRALAPA